MRMINNQNTITKLSKISENNSKLTNEILTKDDIKSVEK